jgi:hypothetical protein
MDMNLTDADDNNSSGLSEKVGNKSANFYIWLKDSNSARRRK